MAQIRLFISTPRGAPLGSSAHRRMRIVSSVERRATLALHQGLGVQSHHIGISRLVSLVS